MLLVFVSPAVGYKYSTLLGHDDARREGTVLGRLALGPARCQVQVDERLWTGSRRLANDLLANRGPLSTLRVRRGR